jgi:hypothetical protein
MLFQHPLVHAAPKWQRGKIARAIAAKVAIAARIDAYRHAGKDLFIAEKLKKRILEIQEKNKLPPSEEERSKKSQEHKRRQAEYFGSKGRRYKERPWRHGRRSYQRHHERQQQYSQQFQGPRRRSEGDQRDRTQFGRDQQQEQQQQYHQYTTDWKSKKPSRKNKKSKKKKSQKKILE